MTRALFYLCFLTHAVSGLHFAQSLRPDMSACVDTGRAEQLGFRFGEADHPGPSLDVCVGTSNPSGFRGKESQALGFGPGIWSFSETQLSCITRKASCGILSVLAKSMSRTVRCHVGADVPCRVNSLWAGAWSGVLRFGDYPCRPLNLGWPPDLYQSSRIVAVQHYVEQCPITVVTLYGYPSSPTWPDSLQRTEALLECVSKEVVHGLRGPRIILGDFNHDLCRLPQCAVWSSLGWAEAQQHARKVWGHDPVATCKHATFRDFLWMSPEALAMFTKVRVEDVFAEHSSVIAHLQVPSQSARF